MVAQMTFNMGLAIMPILILMHSQSSGNSRSDIDIDIDDRRDLVTCVLMAVWVVFYILENTADVQKKN
eukprot:CAMPEP_0116938532 /NCGR_PEP_ID=MMETSP0467-20121206/32183_1 /TAXON_ID=283647 /ORGANISM="Mesodinium pulex, Strain SPMC105" /LENGTH=67 /DNA_ID=CAMNT_0004620611 /DNA_START=390 /DNA_END=593 /DNA_ORIENTATION=+